MCCVVFVFVRSFANVMRSRKYILYTCVVGVHASNEGFRVNSQVEERQQGTEFSPDGRVDYYNPQPRV
jgi:hypothetical protein